MKFVRRTRSEVDINLTPLIDVVFLLLIFFMVSTTFIRDSHLTIDLPVAASESARVTKDLIEITISKSGSFAINGVGLISNSPKVLKQALGESSKGDSSRPLVITADASTPHQAVVTAMDIAGQLGFVHLSITTKGNETGENNAN